MKQSTNKIYVIDGQDRCGKSTAVDILRKSIKNHKILVIHSSKPPANVDPKLWSVDYYTSLLSTVLDLHDKGYDIILDRSWLGETVYGPIYRNVNIPLHELESILYQQSSDLKKFRILVLVDNPTYCAARSDGLSMTEDLEELSRERLAFKEAVHNTVIPFTTLIDWEYEEFSRDNLQKIINEALLKDVTPNS